MLDRRYKQAKSRSTPLGKIPYIYGVVKCVIPDIFGYMLGG